MQKDGWLFLWLRFVDQLDEPKNELEFGTKRLFCLEFEMTLNLNPWRNRHGIWNHQSTLSEIDRPHLLSKQFHFPLWCNLKFQEASKNQQTPINFENSHPSYQSYTKLNLKRWKKSWNFFFCLSRSRLGQPKRKEIHFACLWSPFRLIAAKTIIAITQLAHRKQS